MADRPPFTLSQRPDGQRELRVPHKGVDEPIVLALDDESARQFGVAVADVLTSLDAGIRRLPIRLDIDGRAVTLEGTADRGLQVTVTA